MAFGSISPERFDESRRTVDLEPDLDLRRERVRVVLRSRSTWASISLGVEELLHLVSIPNTEERLLLRAIIERCTPVLHQPCFDRTCLIRTGALRLLSREPETADRDLFIQEARTYESSAGVDVAAEMRGLALLGLEDPELARWLAAECLYDGPVPNEEPHLTAVRVLAARGDATLLRHWLESRDGPVETTATIEAHVYLMRAMPGILWTSWVTKKMGAEQPLTCMAVVEAAVDQGRTDLVPTLIDLLFSSDLDLFRALAMSLAVAREPAFVEALLGICNDVPPALREVYAEALMVARNRRVPAVLARLRAIPTRGGPLHEEYQEEEDSDDED